MPTRCRYELWAESACYPRSTFYPLSRWSSITEPPDHYVLLHLLDCRSRVGLPLLHYQSDFDRPGNLRTPPLRFGRSTAPNKLPTMHGPLTRWRVSRTQRSAGWYFMTAPQRLAYVSASLPTYPTQVTSKSNAKLQKHHGPFRLAAGRLWSSQPLQLRVSGGDSAGHRYAIRAGRNLPDTISLPRTVIVTGRRLSVSIRCSHIFTNLPSTGRRHTLYVHFRVSRVLCFNKQSQPLIFMTLRGLRSKSLTLEAYLSRSYGINLPSSSPEFSSALEFHPAHLCRFAWYGSIQTEA